MMLYPQYFIDDLKDACRSGADYRAVYAAEEKRGELDGAAVRFIRKRRLRFRSARRKGFYKCFGCGKGGSVYKFLMEMEGLNFPEAIKAYCRNHRRNPLPEPIDDKQYEKKKKRKQEKKKLADQIVELTASRSIFGNRLQRRILRRTRRANISKNAAFRRRTQKAFHIGFSPDSWDALLNVCKGNRRRRKADRAKRAGIGQRRKGPRL